MNQGKFQQMNVKEGAQESDGLADGRDLASLPRQSSIVNRQSSIEVDLSVIQDRLSSARGKDYWRSLEELAEAEEFREMLQREFPQLASEWEDPVGRRRFLKLMGASLALA